MLNPVCYNRPMLRILLLHSRDWLNPLAGPNEDYLHQVFKRIANRGHYVAWVAATSRGDSGHHPKSVQIIDGIQLARIGRPVLYRLLTGMLLPRLRHSAAFPSDFDAVVEAITGKPLSLADKIDWPVFPLVFRLSRSLHPSSEPPGPILAATEGIRRELTARGVPESFIVRAPFGVASSEIVPASERCTPPHGIALMTRRQEPFLHQALEAQFTHPLA